VTPKSFGIASLMLCFLVGAASSPMRSAESHTQSRQGCLIFLYDSHACQCVRERNAEFTEFINRQIDNDIIDTTLIRYQYYDYSAEPHTVDSLHANLPERFLPELIMKSCDNILFYEGSFYLDTVRFMQGLADFNMISTGEQHRD